MFVVVMAVGFVLLVVLFVGCVGVYFAVGCVLLVVLFVVVLFCVGGYGGFVVTCTYLGLHYNMLWVVWGSASVGVVWYCYSVEL